PALNMPEDRDASLEARSLFNLPPDHFTNAAQVDVAELVELLILGHQVAVAGEFEPFGHHHNGEDAAARVALLKYLGDLFDGGRPFGDEDAIRAAGQASHGSDPARVPAHNFHNHDALVRLCGGMEPVNGLGDDRNCGVKTERLIRPFDVVVNGLGHPHDVHTLHRERTRHPQRVFTAHRNDVINLKPLEVGAQLFHVAFAL